MEPGDGDDGLTLSSHRWVGRERVLMDLGAGGVVSRVLFPHLTAALGKMWRGGLSWGGNSVETEKRSFVRP